MVLGEEVVLVGQNPQAALQLQHVRYCHRSLPSIRTRPRSGISSPTSSRMVVVLPEPLRPRKPVRPALRWKSRSVDDPDDEIRYEAVRAAGNWEVDAAWPHMTAMLAAPERRHIPMAFHYRLDLHLKWS